jgi:hypothetical protein
MAVIQIGQLEWSSKWKRMNLVSTQLYSYLCYIHFNIVLERDGSTEHVAWLTQTHVYS